MKLKLFSIILLIVMLLTSNVISNEDVYAEEITSTGIISVLVGGGTTVAVKNNGEIYVWGTSISGDYAVYDLSKGIDSIPLDNKLFVKSNYPPSYSTDTDLIDGALPSKSVNICGIILSVSYEGRIILNTDRIPSQVINTETLIGSQKILTDVKEVSKGRITSIGVKNDGSVIAWGDNSFWQATNARNIFSVKAVTAGYYHLACLKEDGTVVVTGYNYYNQGKIPEGLKNVKAIAAGDYHTVALKEDGTVSVWGNNNYGQCDVPEGLDRVVDIDSGGDFVVALRDDGTIVAWGNNGSKQCNVPEKFKWQQEEPVNTSPSSTPTPISSSTPSAKNTTFKKVFGGENTLLAITKDGLYTYWGGMGAMPFITPLFPGVQKAKSVSIAYHHAAMLDENGRVFMSGTNYTGDNAPKDLTNIKQIACGEDFTAALKEDGSVLAWGDNMYGQCRVPKDLGKVKEIACGYDFVLALKEDGTLRVWGNNKYNIRETAEGINDVKSIAATGHHSLALKNDGTVVSIGDDWGGAFTVPQGLAGVKSITCSYFLNAALKEDGTLVLWGLNNNIPKDLKNIKHVVAGYSYILAIREDGSTVIWGISDELANAFPDTLIIEDSKEDILLGDLNLDNTINSIDLAFLRMYLLGLKDSLPSKNGIIVADLNGDGLINSIDLALLRKYLLGMIFEFPVSR